MPAERASAMAMLKHRKRTWFALVATAAATAHPACSTKAVGVEECRRIEYARCEAAPHCPDQFEIADAEQCKLFYRDHCLHGMALSAAPKTSSVNNCVNAIQTLAKCAEQDASTPLPSCDDGAIHSDKPKLTTVCKLLAEPEAIPECSFLVQDDTATGGQTSTGGQSTGGASDESAGSGGTGSDPALGQGGTTDSSVSAG
jgi:hypothetical protein